MKWNSSLSIGIDAIDAQHKQIFEYLLALENSVMKRDPWNIQRFFLSQLEDYMKFHLAVEEALLEIIRYPDLAYHRDSHARLIDQIAELEKKMKSGATGENLVGFFESWFSGHVLSSDRRYAAYAKNEFPALYGAKPA